MPIQQKFVALLRGINVGGKHKVPMAQLRQVLEEMGFTGIKTLLNSGNVIFEAPKNDPEEIISMQLQKSFGFPIPVLVRKAEEIRRIVQSDPFKDIRITQDIRLYITFIKSIPQELLSFPWTSPDGSFHLLGMEDKTVSSILDLSVVKTPDAMAYLEKIFGKNITTRNWNTVIKINSML
jgi:uncharacterized protein (DUF1697 family)